MTITARYDLKRGGSGMRPIVTSDEARKILTGGYGATNVRLENEKGEVIGERMKYSDIGWVPDNNRDKWYWWLDEDVFDV